MSPPALSWDAMFNMKKLELELNQILTCTYSLTLVGEVTFIIFLIDIVKSAINI